jgi:hypothetical protein
VAANWPIADSVGVVGSGTLRFVIRPGLSLGPSISVIINNPPWTGYIGLSPKVWLRLVAARPAPVGEIRPRGGPLPPPAEEKAWTLTATYRGVS